MKRNVVILIIAVLLLTCACATSRVAEYPSEGNELEPEETQQLQEDQDIEELEKLGIGIHEDAWGTLRDNAEKWAGDGEWLYRAKGSIGPYDTIVIFCFNDAGLYGCEHLVSGTEDKVTKFNTLDTFLTENYGEARRELFYTGDQKQVLSSFEEVCEQNGLAQKVWRLENTIIYLEMKADGSVYVEVASLTEVK